MSGGGKGGGDDFSGTFARQAIQAQGQANRQALEDFQRFSQIGEVNPFGQRRFEGEIGTPGRTAITELSPEVQQLFNQQLGVTGGLLGLGQQLAGTPIDFSGLAQIPGQEDLLAGAERASGAVFERGQNLLQPDFTRQRQTLETTLANQGIPRGSPAFNEAVDRLERSQGNQLENLALSAVGAGGAEQSRLFGLGQAARQQGIQELLTQRGQPISELASILGGASVPLPQFQPLAQQGTSPVNVLGAQGLLQQQQAQPGFGQQLAGGLLGLGGQLGGAALLNPNIFQ